MARTSSLILSVLLVVCVASPARTDLIVAEQLLVDLDVQTLNYGPVTGAWTNAGTLGDFTPSGQPVVEDVAGVKTVTFNGANWFNGPASPAGITGAGTRTIEVWALNPALPAEETMVSWSRRGGPDGTNMSFNYGNDTRWGAVGHWGGDTHDMGWWGANAPAPAAGDWWHLAYTYDGASARVYVNGVQESIRTIAINTHAGNIIRVGAQADNAGTGATFMFTGSIAQVRIHDGALTAAQVMNNYRWSAPRNAWKPNPADQDTVQQVALLLSWRAGAFAAEHHVYLSDNAAAVAAGTAAADRGVMSDIGYFAIGLVPGTTYYWRVDEVNDTHPQSPWVGGVWSFTVASDKAYQPSPPDGAVNVPTSAKLSWQPGINMLANRVYFGTDYSTVLNSTTPQTTLQTNTWTPPALAKGATYYWRIDTVNQSMQTIKGDVWSFTTLPDIPVSDPNLVGWWKFDEGFGSVAVDWSGHDRHAAILGGTTWVGGYYDGALSLDGVNGYVDLPIDAVMATLNGITVAGWVNFDNAGGAWQRIIDFGNSDASQYLFLCPRTGTAGPMRLAITTAGGGGESLIETTSTLAGGWHHVAAVVGQADMQLYVDGVLAVSGSTATPMSALGTTANNWLGRSQYAADGYLSGDLDDFRIYDYAMTAQEIPQAMRGDPLLAWNPQPGNGASVTIDQVTSISWMAGDLAVQHDVYFGVDASAVANATTTTAGIYKGRQTGTTYAAGLEMGRTYYWRIDEVNSDSTITKGRVWSFTVLDYLIVDDFESYG
ncbi:MAG TPA: LamG domain-containing protein, partial [Phycisphaerales bacterium]|nr:LamG domain-containing protein [Phycisphaerales bacterium]